MVLTLRKFDSPALFADAVMLALLAHEAEHGLMIGLLSQALENSSFWPEQMTMIAVERDGAPVAVSMHTPPYEPIVSRLSDFEAVPLLVDYYLSQPDIPGVHAPVDAGAEFARIWSLKSGQRAEISMPERIYKIERVRPVIGVPGELRAATVDDRELLIAWNRLFVEDAFHDRALPGQAERMVEARLTGSQSGFAIWEVGEPVCLVGWSGPTPNGIRIGPVYTPPEHRRNGYASAATAGVSQFLLDEGRTFCMLFADLENPTSNKIYQAIGYEPVADIAVYRFTR